MRFASKKPCMQHESLSGEATRICQELHCVRTVMHVLAKHGSQIQKILHT